MSLRVSGEDAPQTISVPTGSLNTPYLVFPILACLGQAWASQRFNLYRAYQWATPITGLVVGAAMNRSLGISSEALIEVKVPERIVRRGLVEVGEMLTWLEERPVYGLEAAEQMCDALREGDVTAFARALGKADDITYLDLNGLDSAVAERLKEIYPSAYYAPEVVPEIVPEVAARKREAIEGPLEVIYARVKSDRARDYRRGVWNYWRGRKEKIECFDATAAESGIFGNGAYAIAALCTNLTSVVVWDRHASQVIVNKDSLEVLTIGMRGEAEWKEWLNVLPEGVHTLRIVSAAEVDENLLQQLDQLGFDKTKESTGAEENYVYDLRKSEKGDSTFLLGDVSFAADDDSDIGFDDTF